MDISDIARLEGTIPTDNNAAVIASIVVLIEGGRTMQSLCGDTRFTSPYGGEVMGATYTGVLGLLASVITKHPLPAIVAGGTILFFAGLYHYQELHAHSKYQA